MSVHGLTPWDFTHDWRTVQAKLDELHATKRYDAAHQVIRAAIAATSNPASQDVDVLENIASYHYQITDGSECECPACLAYDRIKGARS